MQGRAGAARLRRHSHGLPGYDPDSYGADDDPVRQIATTYQSVEFVALRNSDEGRTCAKCGHVNDPFPAERWGWARQAYQTRAASAAYRTLVEAAS